MYPTHTCPVTGLVFVKIPSPVGFRYKLKEKDLVGKVGPDLWMATTAFCPIHVPESLTDLTKNWKRWDDNRKPFGNMTWNELNKQDSGFIARLNAIAGITYRLPSEFEWEWSAYGGEDFNYAGCTDWRKTSVLGREWKEGPKSTGFDCGRLSNGYGLYDMVGNCWEWTSSILGVFQGWGRVSRGGGWNFDALNARVAYRSGDAPSERYDHLGFRLCFGGGFP